MDIRTRTLDDLVIANRVLANEGVLDAFGHVSARDPERPDRFFLSRSRSAGLVEVDDLIEYGLDGEPSAGDRRPGYLERFIHSAVYRARPDVAAVVHSHAREVLPFSVTRTPLRPAVHSAAVIGAKIPVWDIRSKFGDTNMLVCNCDQGADLAAMLGSANAVLMRGHGFVAVAVSLLEATYVAMELRTNAAVLSEALKLDGPVTYLSAGELAALSVRDATATYRGWEFWATRAGCADRLGPPPVKRDAAADARQGGGGLASARRRS